MTATLILIRHAAHADLDIRYSGRRPGVSLTEVGRAQAATLAASMGGQVDAVECSPLERTRETAAAIAAVAGVAVTPVAALIELDLGDWTGRAFGTLGDDPAWHRWNAERGTARIPGGETMAEAQGRIVAHLADTAARHAGRTVAIVTHADMIRGAVAHVLGLPLDHLLRFDVDPASATRVAAGDWGMRLLSLNEVKP